ncbi:MAG: DUF5916 domain-containing protein [Armatimonadota bacterium]|nr:DUF5916 domain-containing protein [Armatimonadota bacterium]
MRAVKVDRPPVIDGVLDDACWQSCARITGFRESQFGREPSERTEVMLCRDESNLYVAFVCYDSQPALIRATQTQINSSISNDDYVGVLIDPEHAFLTHYHFEVNAIGTQYHSVPEGAPANITWRGDWQAAAKITDLGWQAEMAIPFAGLRYPAGQRTFSIQFRRYIPRLDERSTWPFAGAVMDQTKFADLVDLELPPQAAKPVLMPYFLSSSHRGSSTGRIGFDYKREMPNHVVFLATCNPDFSDVQDAVASVSYSYTEQYLPERRPFFQEGSSLFPDSTVFYSRRIGEIDWGLKAFGKLGPHTLAVVDALNWGKENHLAAAYAYDPNPDLSVSLWASLSRVSAQSTAQPRLSTCVAPGFVKRWRSAAGRTSFSVRRYDSFNSDGAPSGYSIHTSLSRDSAPRHFDYALSWLATSGDFYVRDGYTPIVGVRGCALGIGYHDRPQAGRFIYWRTDVNAARYWSEDGGVHHDSVSVSLDCDTRNEWSFGATLKSGSWLGLADFTAAGRVEWLERHLYGCGSLVYVIGKRSGRRYREVDFSQSLRPLGKLTISIGSEWAKLGSPGVPETKLLLTLLANYEVAPDAVIGLWLVGRGSDKNVCITYKRTARSGSDVYFIYGYPNSQRTEHRIAVKVVVPVAFF